MLLPGRLRLSTLGDVLGAVFREGATGVLELTEESGAHAGRVHRIHVVGGLVADVECAIATARLGAIARRLGLISEMGQRSFDLRLASAPGRRVGELLVEDGLVSRPDLARMLRVQRRERLERLFLLHDARLAFRVARAAHRGVSWPLEPSEFLHGRPRARDRGASGVVPGRRRDPVRARALSTLGLPESADPTTVQRAFRKLAAEMHPDRFPTAGVDERAVILRRFAELTAAYHALVA